MFYHFLYPFKEHFFAFNVFKYITFRAGGAFLTSFLLVLLTGNWFIRTMQRKQIKQKINMYGFEHLQNLHRHKEGTPTMGGLLIVGSVLVTLLFWGNWQNRLFIYSLLVFVELGILGLYDDYLKMERGQGLSRMKKFSVQALIGLLAGMFIFIDPDLSPSLVIPFFKDLCFYLGLGYILWTAFVVSASSNAVNFSDGLDGLAGGCIVSMSVVFAVLSYVCGNLLFSHYLFIPYVRGAGELAVLCAALAGSTLGFLWFNCYPAQIFMGDVGSLAIGGTLGMVAVLIKKEFLFVIAGGVFVLEAFSVVLQILSVKLGKKKLFRAAPIHHHYQLSGIAESKIVIRFWIVAVILSVVSMLSLKIQ
jgi:phospho-N-acetylmuramoyl-pentapeptide-transferase